MGELILLRHGETEWSRDGKHTGRTDIPLTPKGAADAAALAPMVTNRLAGDRLAAVFASPAQRAQRTAKLAGLTVTKTDPDLWEWDYGGYEGITTAEIHERRPDWTLWRDGCPNGESAADVGARADRLIAEARATEGDVIFFGHGHMLRVIGARWVDLPPEDGGLLGLGTGSLCTLGYEHDLPILVHWNEPGA